MIAQDHRWMAEALRQARRGLYSTHPNPRVGCVIVRNGEMISSGWHEYTGGPHAEVNAIESATIPPGADFYVTLEPCSHHGRTPPCVDAVIAQKPARVLVAMEDPNPAVAGRGLTQMREQGIDVTCGVMEDQARALNPGFIKRMRQGLPRVGVKMACSLDGRSALANGTSQWITGEAARRDVQYLRARASAVLTSAQTILDDNPSMSLRLSSADLGQSRAPRHPVRVVLDTNLRLQGDEKIFTTDGDVWIYTCVKDADAQRRLHRDGVSVIPVDADGAGRIDLQAVMRDLAAREINEIHTECGKTLSGALLRAGLADYLVLYLAPQLLGDRARGGFDLGELTRMDQRIDCETLDLRQVGDDIRLTLALH